MGIDIRFPIGLMFGLIGLLLSGFGLFGDKSIYSRSLGININLIWGFVMMIFGAIMMGLAVRAHGVVPPSGDESSTGETRH
jgi:hypothetical protein